jgi:hypothetical protein
MKHTVERDCGDSLPIRYKRKNRRRFPDGAVTACKDCGALFLATSSQGGYGDHSWTTWTWTEVSTLGN